MKNYIFRMIKLIVGIFLVALGGVFMINANIGMISWDVLHSGICNVTNMTIGQAIILVNIMLTIVGVILKEKIGLGTILNILLVGTFVDKIKSVNIIPLGDSLIMGFIMINIGMIVMAIGTAMYISTEFGCGAKDAVTMALSKILNKPIKQTRTALELVVVVIGILLGGAFGIITIYGAVVFGILMQYTFKVLKCDAQNLEHVSILDMFSTNEFSKKMRVLKNIFVS